MTATELQDLSVDELSGVDAPATGIPGWMVIKSEDGAAAAVEAQLASLYASLGQARSLEAAPEGVRKAAEDLALYVEKQLTSEEEDEPLITKMRNIFKRQAKDATTAQKAKKKKKAKAPPWAGDDDNDADDDASVTKSGVAGADNSAVKKAAKSAVKKAIGESVVPVIDDVEVLREALTKAFDRIEALEDLVVGSSQAPGQEGTSPVEKNEPTLHDAILSAAAGNRVTIT